MEPFDHPPLNPTRPGTQSVKLVAVTLAEAIAAIDAMDPPEKAQVSADWLARLHASTEADPWTHGFPLVLRDNDALVGKCGFKGPPAADGTVEIAYCVDPDYQGKGYATEAAEALVAFAFGSGRVRMVRAHTLPQSNASTRVLAQCGVRHISEVIEPEDGLVWRWEKHREPQNFEE